MTVFRSLRTQIALLVLFVMFTTVAMLGFYVERRSATHFIDVAGNGLSALARSTAQELDRQVQIRAQQLDGLAAMPDFRLVLVGGCQQSYIAQSRLNAASGDGRGFSWLALATGEGKLCVADQHARWGADVTRTDAFRRGREGLWVGEISSDAVAPARWAIDIAAPVKAPDNRVMGVMMARLDSQWLAHIQQHVLLPLLEDTGAAAAVLNDGGELLMVSGEADLSSFSELDVAALRNTRARWRVETDGAGARWIRGYGSNSVDTGDISWTVVLSQPVAAALAPLRAFRSDIAFGALVLILFFMVISIPVSAWLTRPIKRLSDAARTLQRGDRGHIPQIRGVQELEVLSISLQNMVESLTSSERALVKMHDQAYSDPLTGLPNRRGLAEYIDELGQAVGDCANAVFLYLDLDRFKPINDQFGHAAGDEVLKEIATRMRSTFRDSDIIARVGGDEFIVVLHNHDGSLPANLSALCERLVARISEPVRFADAILHVGCSVGVAFWQSPAPFERVMAQADAALYDAKRAGRSRVVFADAMAVPG